MSGENKPRPLGFGGKAPAGRAGAAHRTLAGLPRSQIPMGVLFLAVSTAYMLYLTDLVLLAIPAAALAASALAGSAPVRKLLALFFLLHLLAASAFLFAANPAYKPQGTLAFMYFASAAAVAWLDVQRDAGKGAMEGMAENGSAGGARAQSAGSPAKRVGHGRDVR
jgi:hypothetical protein